MKLFIILFYFAPIFFTPLFSQEIEKINIYFLPWKFHIEGRVTEELVRNYPGHSKFVTITNKSITTEFLKTISILNCRPNKNTYKEFTPRMIIEIYGSFHEMSYNKTVYLNSRQILLYDERFFYKNFMLENWLNKNVFD